MHFCRKVLTGFAACGLIGAGICVQAQLAAPAAQTSAPAAATQPAAAPASTTDIVGTWQGTLNVPNNPKPPRIVIKITKADSGVYKALLYNADQGSPPVMFNSVTDQNGAVRLVASQMTFEGKLSADGQTIDGSVTGGPNPLPLTLARANADTAWAIPEPPKPMAADANPSFEVATVKPSDPNRPGQAFLWRGGRFLTINTTLTALIGFAYDVQDKQVVGGQDWMSTDKFDIEAKPDTPGTPSREQMRTMLEKLLADRFQLKFHADKKELPAYVLTASKTGPKMKKNDIDPNGLPGLFFRKLGDLNVRNATMGDFVHLMQSAVLDRPVVDETELAGKWDFELNWTPDDSQFGGMGVRPPAPSDAPDAPPPLFTAIQEQLGLKLESGKAQVDVMVIDHVEKPSPN